MKDYLGFFDAYTLKARFIPAILATLPLLALIGCYFNLNQAFVSNVVVGGLVAFSSIFLLSNFARLFGLKVERKLVLKWGVLPTTQFLRHNDLNLSAQKKHQIHLKITAKSSIVLPSASQESNDPLNSDLVYDEAVAWIRENTRGSDFSVLLADNINYGFIRNCLGLKYIAISICVLVLIIFSVLFFSFYPASSFNQIEVLKFLKSQKMAIWLTLGLTIVMLVLWITMVTENNVTKAAHKYAKTLLNSTYKL
ncbi:hypothetical protein ACQP7C_03605 [Acinetobacter baumannii]|uniref:hypothetical protein n=1 Tax=Acinetobacter baumannii TaxID=470 RepID=UPI003CFF0DF2